MTIEGNQLKKEKELILLLPKVWLLVHFSKKASMYDLADKMYKEVLFLTDMQP